MKKLILIIGLLLSQASFADTSINIPVPNGGALAPKGGTIALKMQDYGIVGVNYSVTCHVNAPEGTQVQVLFSGLNPSFQYVNGKQIGFAQVTTLLQGDNTVEFSSLRAYDKAYAVYDADAGKFGFTNLDNTVTLTMSNCKAKPTA